MSKKAITGRLKAVNQLRKVCLSLANSNIEAKLENVANKETKLKSVHNSKYTITNQH